ncbi:MAG: hypothetical protein AUH15_12145 [Acidobacteriales bacterium 13_2_20CM_55_8]|nr:MAG: hypothetical protein AUH15_12145 [Acidobacteriales bacterium 13_2_20CM_55_8]
MSSGFLTHAVIRVLDALAQRVLAPNSSPEHQRTGRRGEEDAYFYLRKLGYVMVARNYRSPRQHGEIDIIGWHKGILCFIELAYVAREYLRRLPPSCQWRFDVLTVYYDRHPSQPQFELFQNAFHLS